VKPKTELSFRISRVFVILIVILIVIALLDYDKDYGREDASIEKCEMRTSPSGKACSALQGRGRQGPSGQLSTAIKDVYVYPLHPDFRHQLNPGEIPTHS